MSEALSRLAGHFGIGAEFHDIWGHVHPTSDDTKRALLRAMGVDAGDDAKAQTSWHATELARWSEVLPPVFVSRPGVAREVRVQLDAALAGTPLTLRIHEENGAPHERSLALASDQAIDRYGHDGHERAAWMLPVDVALPDGYHRLAIERDGTLLGESTLIVAPASCWEPASIAAGARVFGPAVQLYALRSHRNWGIGDFSDLATVVEQWAAQGGNVVGVNPLHALFPHDPERASPYSPSSRLFFNPLYVDLGDAEE